MPVRIVAQARNATATTAVSRPDRQDAGARPLADLALGLEGQETSAVDRNRSRVVSPPSSAYGLSRVSRSPGELACRRRSARRRRCSRTRRPTAAPARGWRSRSPRPSGCASAGCRSCPGTRARRRARSARRGSGRGRGRSPENSVAYHSGKAANVAPPATSSQTSLPSQTGPIVCSIARRSVSSRPRTGQQHADAEVEALEDEVADPEDGDEQEPDGREFHRRSPQYPRAERRLGLVLDPRSAVGVGQAGPHAPDDAGPARRRRARRRAA